MTDSASQSLVERLPELPDDHSDLTPELALKVVGKYRELLSQQAARITELEAERDRLANRLDLLAVGFGVCDGGKYIADWQAKIAHFKCALAAESDLSRVRDELDTSNNNHRAMARQRAELGARCKHAESELSRVEGERNEFRSALKGLSDMYGSTWDRVDGALMMMDSGIKRFEKAHAIAYKILQRLPASPLRNPSTRQTQRESE